ncbi:hypothetical protein FRC01_003473 [Tulasnella sp. 417]|nr:hypothetical protein FRC01_003473 [Tulasnella sp. 417]
MPIYTPQVVHDVQIVNDVHPAKDDAATATTNATCLFCSNSPAASLSLCRSCAKQHADAAVAIVDEEDDRYYARRDHALSHTADAPYDALLHCIASTSSFPPPDPYRDITHISASPRGNNALYPGATFAGTQKSGRNNYEVTVTVLDVDFVTSQLSGYLKIKGLTDDWPELTTYFDAEIIGERYGFLTTQPDLGATETEDMTHWGRFPAFRSLKNEMRRPNLTISDRHREKKGVVFMRWKERFLVPDWKVRDINGASFAGFYYVCVEFNPGRGSSPTAPSFADDDDFPTLGSPVSPIKSRSSGPATMTGFYYHADSEPYQQLSLAHVPEERQQVAFEFR